MPNTMFSTEKPEKPRKEPGSAGHLQAVSGADPDSNKEGRRKKSNRDPARAVSTSEGLWKRGDTST